MKARILGIGSQLLLVCMLCATVVGQDQPQQGRGGRGPGGGGFGGFGGPGMGRGLAGGGALELLGLCRMEEVRKEIGLGEEGYAAIQDLQRELFAGFGGGPGGPGGGRPGGRPGGDQGGNAQGGNQGGDRGQGRGPGGPGGGGRGPQLDPEKIKEFNAKAQAILDEVLEPKGMDRLLGLYVQQRQMSAAVNDLVAKKINVTDDQKKAITEALEKLSQEQRDKMMAAFQGGGGGRGNFDPEAFAKMREENTKASNEAVAKVLDDAQEKALNDLKGAEFKFPEMGFGGRGGPGGGQGGPGGQGGRGGRGGRPAGDNT